MNVLFFIFLFDEESQKEGFRLGWQTIDRDFFYKLFFRVLKKNIFEAIVAVKELFLRKGNQ
jgi:hypothetical protein